MVRKAIGIGVALVVGVTGTTAAQGATLVVAHGFSPSHTNVVEGLIPWQECVTAATNGDVTFEHYPSGQISGHADGTHSMKEGIAHVVGIPPAYESEKFPLNIMIQLPGVSETAEKGTAVYRTLLDGDNPIGDEWRALEARPLLAMLSAPYQLMTAGEPIDTMEKLAGKKIRTAAGPMTYAVESLGATPIDMGTPDMYIGLQRGTIDGTILAVTSAPAYNLHEVVGSISTNGAFSSAHTVWAIDNVAYDGLSPENQKAVTDCGLQIELESAIALDVAAETIAADYATQGVTFYEFPPEMKAAIDESLSSVAAAFVADLDSRGLPGQQAYDAMIQALEAGK
jgi:TRAP-type C4-dicarboxylate transport system substrate-binding protein